MYAPLIKSARRVREHVVGRDLGAVLLTDIEPDDRSRVRYAHLLVVFRRGERDPIAFISSEIAAAENAQDGSHFLCAFLANGRKNQGANDAWADVDKFERAALQWLPQLLPGAGAYRDKSGGPCA